MAIELSLELYRAELEPILADKRSVELFETLDKNDEEYMALIRLLIEITEEKYLPSYASEPKFYFDEKFHIVADTTSVLYEIAKWDISDYVSARIYDYIWITRKDYCCGKQAIERFCSHFNSGTNIKEVLHSLYRIIALRKQLLKDKASYSDLADGFRKHILQWNSFRDRYRLLELCELISIIPTNEALEIIESEINRLKDNLNEYDSIEKCVELYEKIYSMQKKISITQIPSNEKTIRNIRRILADSLLLSARNQNAGTGIRINLFTKAFHILKTISATEEERKRVLRELEVVQKKLKSEMKSFEFSLDISEQMTKIQTEFALLNKDEAICYFAYRQGNITLRETEEQLHKESAGGYLANLVPKELVDASGKRVASLCSLEEAAKNKEKWYIHCVHRASQFLDLYGMVIYYLLDQLHTEHQITEDDIMSIVTNSCFIPESRKSSYQKGLWAGFQKDFLQSLSILIPQFENSVRELVKMTGEIVYNIKENDVQEVKTLNGLLELPKVKETFDDDFLLAIHALFCSSYGLNLRNKQAHGLVSDDFYHSYQACFIWWYIFSLCYKMQKVNVTYPIINTMVQKLKSIDTNEIEKDIQEN